MLSPVTLLSTASPFIPDGDWEGGVLLSWLLAWCALKTVDISSILSFWKHAWLLGDQGETFLLKIVHSKKRQSCLIWGLMENIRPTLPHLMSAFSFPAENTVSQQVLPLDCYHEEEILLAIQEADCRILLMKSKAVSGMSNVPMGSSSSALWLSFLFYKVRMMLSCLSSLKRWQDLFV